MTHNLFGVAEYGAQKKTGMTLKTKIALLAVSVGSNVIPDIDIQWTTKADATYLTLHRGLTHSFLMAPVWAALFSLLCYLIFRIKGKRIFFTALIGVLLHIVSDWSNAWGTGLLEPFTSRRYAGGFIPNKGYVFWAIAAVILALLLVAHLLKKPQYRLPILRGFWALSALYVVFQLAQAAYVYWDLKSQGFERVAIRADRLPGGMSYYAMRDDAIVEGRHEFPGGGGIVRSYGTYPIAEDSLPQDSRTKALLQFAPFLAAEDLGDSVRLFDPRFAGRVGFLEITVPKNGGISP